MLPNSDSISIEKPREDWNKYFKKNSGLIIDLGCGDGDDSYFLAKKGYKVIAVDENNDNLKFHHPNLTFIKQKLEIPIDNQFDGVIANFSLHLLFPEVRLKIIDHYLKRLKPGGIFYILIFKKFVTLPFLNLFPEKPSIEYFLKEEDHVPDGKHTHEIAKIIYKKP
jgi:SAM-dependent methyltransferase